MAAADTEQEKQAILRVIEDECAAFYERDFERWSGHWMHNEGTLRLVAHAGGQVAYLQGWEAEASMVARLFRENPTPNFTGGARVTRENVRIRVGGEMAWASFDQYVPATDDNFCGVGLSYHVRIFEKHQGRWKIAHVGHADTRLETFNGPIIRVDKNATIMWMNDAATAQLNGHPVLTKDRAHLAARTRADDKLLRTAIETIANLTPLDVRPTSVTDSGHLAAIPVILGDGITEIPHVVWVMYQDQMVLISFNDPETERQRLATAKSVFGLSKAQARVAALIVEGNDIGKIAEQMGITVNTARTHLQRMFDKTGVRSQTALVRILLNAITPGS